ncbi:cation:proton antiporter [Biformimicrobium ophioploci]|uniref:Cation/H+ exchanger transmembrane domain-containing protein n=1 Tax=Biformimicrobium ophioploci TaxID=3036711 RepID=A0ABQ6M2G2_9GAMM|nr:sodium:proton antiporter [Microbulbifer sp. NKW57]GMG88530.1 hypothetical protein MNKW57_28510 [Microbulbifer sp. NKW57]
MYAVVTLVGQGLFLALVALTGMWIARFFRGDNTLGCLIAGILAGLLLPVFEFDTGLRYDNIRELVFFLILPILIFRSAWLIDPRIMRRWLMPVLLLATVGVVICWLLVALLTYFGIAHPSGFPWHAALLTGVILAATDPMSVVSKLRQDGADENLVALMEGESIFNDAAAIVLFTVVLGVATSGDGAGLGAVSLYFAVIFLGGIAVGAICGLLVAIVVLLLRNPAASQIALVMGAIGSFYLAEHLAGVSGIMSVMVCAIIARVCLHEHRQAFLKHTSVTWEWLGLLFEALVFVIMGLAITFGMFETHWLAMLIAIAATLLARTVAIFALTPASNLVGRPVPLGWKWVMIWGGLRGVIAIALVLSLPVDLPYWYTVQSMVFGVVLFSVLVQGTSTGLLIKKAA